MPLFGSSGVCTPKVRVGKTRSLILKGWYFLLKVTEIVSALLESCIKQLGYELYDVDFHKEYDTWELVLIIDRPEGITLDDCEKVSRAVEPLLDKADPIEQAYYLTVSSVGLDRPLRLSKDYDRNIGNMLDIKLYSAPAEKALKGKKAFIGRLVSHDNDTFTVDTQAGVLTFAKKSAALLRPHLDF